MQDHSQGRAGVAMLLGMLLRCDGGGDDLCFSTLTLSVRDVSRSTEHAAKLSRARVVVHKLLCEPSVPEQPLQRGVHGLKSLQFRSLMPIWLRFFTFQMK